MIRLLGGLLAALTVAATGCGSDAPTDATIGIHYSKFGPTMVTAAAGVPLTITLQNDDPIEHEWIVGSDEVHARHRTGTEPYHDAVPTEVTIPALTTKTTTVTFEETGLYTFVCHLPGHESYGMVGVLRVVDG